MSENQSEATEAAQNVVDRVTSYEYSSDEQRVSEALDAGLDEAGVDVEEGEKQRLISEILSLKQDETEGTPTVDEGTAEDA